MAQSATQLTEIVPATAERISLTDADAAEWIRGRYARTDDAYVRINMITTLTGSATGSDGTSDSISSRADRRILGVIRADADAIVVGAATVRAEGYTVPRVGVLVVVTDSGDLSGHNLGEGADERVRLLCSADAAPRVRAASPGLEVIPVAGEVTPGAIRAALADRGMRRLVCEGGPGLASQFVAAGVVDEICVTSAPALEPADRPFLSVDERPALRVAGMLADDAGFSYLRLAMD